jgi:hypothetical protein
VIVVDETGPAMLASLLVNNCNSCLVSHRWHSKSNKSGCYHSEPNTSRHCHCRPPGNDLGRNPGGYLADSERQSKHCRGSCPRNSQKAANGAQMHPAHRLPGR